MRPRFFKRTPPEWRERAKRHHSDRARFHVETMGSARFRQHPENLREDDGIWVQGWLWIPAKGSELNGKLPDGGMSRLDALFELAAEHDSVTIQAVTDAAGQFSGAYRVYLGGFLDDTFEWVIEGDETEIAERVVELAR